MTVVPDNVIQAETDTSIEELGDARAISNDECLRNVGRTQARSVQTLKRT